MIRKLFLLLFLALTVKTQAQASLGLDSAAVYNDTTTFFSWEMFQVNVKNTGNATLNDTVTVYAYVDTGGVWNFFDSVVTAASLPPAGSVGVVLQDTVMPSVFRSGVNTVVIWPKANGILTTDSIFLYFFVDNTGAGSEEHDLKTGFVMYPNPAQDELNFVSLSWPNPYSSISFYDVNGRLALRSSFNSRTDVSSLPSGIYFIQITRKDGGVISTRFVKK